MLQRLNSTFSIARKRGFTLIEAMIAAAVLGFLAAIAWPIFTNQLLEMRRRDGVEALMMAHHEMQQCKTDQGTYTGCVPATLTSPNNHYTIASVVTGGGSGFSLTATKTLADDPQCVTLTLDNLGRKNYTGTAPNFHRCWGD